MRIVLRLTSAVAMAGLIGATGASAQTPMITGKQDLVCASQDVTIGVIPPMGYALDNQR